MFNHGFTVCLSSLDSLNPGEQGVVTRFHNTDETTLEKIKEMGITLGTYITVEKRFPSYAIKVGENTQAIDKNIACAIGVRITKIK